MDLVGTPRQHRTGRGRAAEDDRRPLPARAHRERAVPLGAAAPGRPGSFIIAGWRSPCRSPSCCGSLPIGAPAALAGLRLFLLVIAIGQARIETHPPARLGAAVPCCRAAGAGLIAALALDPEPAASRELVAATALLVGLDGIDGTCRRQRLASAFGARFDMEVDALTIPRCRASPSA